MPFWRSLDKTMAQVDKKLTGLQSSTAAVDAHMEKFEQINAKTDKAEHALTVSAFTQFAIAFLVMAVASGGAFVNFKLIALPMSEMVGAGDYISSSLRTSEVAALVIIDRKSTRLNSSHLVISYAVFCLKKKKHAWLSPSTDKVPHTAPY